MNRSSKSTGRMKRTGGFTLVEALLSVFFLGVLATGVATVYSTGLRSLDEQADRMLLDGHLRGRMEVLIATDFSALGNGSEVVSVNGKEYTITWTVAPVDLDGDMTPESTAKQATVAVSGLSGRSLSTILVDSQGQVNRI